MTAVAGSYGGGNQRARIKMTGAEVEEFLDQGRTLTMCTLNHDGSIHAVAMWYGLIGGQVVAHTKAKSQKAHNLRRDPRMTCLLEAGDRYEELRGVELVGRAELVERPDELLAIGVSVYGRNVGTYGEAVSDELRGMLNKRVGIRLRVERVVSWDHRKLAGPQPTQTR